VKWPVDETKRNYNEDDCISAFPCVATLDREQKAETKPFGAIVLLSHHSCRQLPHQELICRQLASANQPFFLTCVARGFVFHCILSEPRGVSFVSLALTLKHLRTMLVTPAPEGPVVMDASKHKQSIMGFEVSVIHALHIEVTTGQLLQSLCRFCGDYFHNCRILSYTSSYSVKE